VLGHLQVISSFTINNNKEKMTYLHLILKVHYNQMYCMHPSVIIQISIANKRIQWHIAWRQKIRKQIKSVLIMLKHNINIMICHLNVM